MASMQRQPSQSRPSSARSPVPEITETPSQTQKPQEEILLPKAEQASQEQASATPPRFTSADDDPSVKKCWICFSDSTEDTPETSPWRDPCPCALVAHEECLLDWIADTEVHKNTARGIISAPQILCPQCKGEIKLARPRNYVVDLVKLFDRSTSRLLMPAGVIILSLEIIYKLTFAYGKHSIYRIFGSFDANRILGPVLEQMARPPIDFDQPLSQIRGRLSESLAFYARHWRLYAGVPLITPMVLMSRTNWYIEDAILTITPTVFFALQSYRPSDTLQFDWPPSAGMAFALLPYARSAYNLYYDRVWGARIKKWKQEILPSISQSQTETAHDHDPIQAIENAAEERNVFEIRVDTGIWEDWEENAPPAEPAQPVAEPAPAAEEAAPAPVVQDNRPAAAARPAQQNGERRLSFSPAELAVNVLGALAFPTVAELSGELLRLLLPTSWTVKPLSALTRRIGPTGVLHEKWGRSLIGGCLFVVFKDALMIYVRWKMAQMHRNRRVLDHDRSKAKTKS